MIKILHITNWFPSKEKPNEANWIYNHTKSLPEDKVSSDVYHFEVLVESTKFSLNKFKQDLVNHTLIKWPIRLWFIVEVVYFLWLFKFFVLQRKHKNYDIINFHIAYPMLTYWHLIKPFVKKPIVVTEHWSAYHYNFGVKKELPRIKRIFSHDLPFITVSNALAIDIRKFAGIKVECSVIPNVIDPQIFHPLKGIDREDFYYMVSQWKEPKTPLLAMEAFLRYSKQENVVGRKLYIGGYGPLWNKMKGWAAKNDRNNQIVFLERQSKAQIAAYMQKCIAFLHPSDYETFSVVCAEAVCCGAKVIALNIGGIPEVVNNGGILLKENNVEHWVKALSEIESFVPPKNVSVSYKRFYPENAGKLYYDTLNKITDDFKK